MNQNGEINMSLLKNIGQAVFDIPVEEELIDQALK